MIKIKLFFITYLLFIFTTCSADKIPYFEHLINSNNGQVTSEKWTRGNVIYIANYDDSGNIISLQLKDDNLDIIVNINEKQIMSYQIESHKYFRIANIDQNGNLLNAEEGMPKGLFTITHEDYTFIYNRRDVDLIEEGMDFLTKPHGYEND